MIQTLEKEQSLTVDPGKTAVFIERELAGKTEIVVGENARVTHYRLHRGADHALSVRIEEGGVYELVTLHIGSGNLNVAVDLAGREAVCRSDIVYVLSGDEQAVVHTDIRHNADNTVSSQLVKGAVGGTAKAAFEGTILIPCERRKIDGAQQHRALLLSPEAEVKAVPQLEIYADDVKCAHGSAIGTLNRQQLYYLRTRGIDENEARAVLTTAFLNEVLDEIKDENIREEFKNLVEAERMK